MLRVAKERSSMRNETLSNISVRLRGFLVICALVFCAAIARGQNGAATFKTNCVACHGEDGSGDTPTGKSLKAANLRSLEIQKKTNTELATVIANGKGNMPAFKPNLSDDQIKSVIAYIRTLKQK
jgi:mono/diheme cytochrome c family protein